MINKPAAKLGDVTQEPVAAIFILLRPLVGRRHGVDFERSDRCELAGIEAPRQLGDSFQPVNDELAVRLCNDQFHLRIHAEQGNQRLGIEMVGVIMARGDNVNEVQPIRRDHRLGHPHMRLVRVRILLRQRIGQVRVEHQMSALPVQQKSALAEPPEMEMLEVLAGGGNVRQKLVVLESWFNHASATPLGFRSASRAWSGPGFSRAQTSSPSPVHWPRPCSLRTFFTPATRFFNFCFAAQRAVWLRPQSGAKERRSAGAYFRQNRTRSATSATVSM